MVTLGIRIQDGGAATRGSVRSLRLSKELPGDIAFGHGSFRKPT
jgi:hypothetical protein